MSDADAKELAWWRLAFSTRFHDDNLPRVGTPLYGYRFMLMVDAEPRPWTPNKP